MRRGWVIRDSTRSYGAVVYYPRLGFALYLRTMYKHLVICLHLESNDLRRLRLWKNVDPCIVSSYRIHMASIRVCTCTCLPALVDAVALDVHPTSKRLPHTKPDSFLDLSSDIQRLIHTSKLRNSGQIKPRITHVRAKNSVGLPDHFTHNSNLRLIAQQSCASLTITSLHTLNRLLSTLIDKTQCLRHSCSLTFAVSQVSAPLSLWPHQRPRWEDHRADI